MAFRCASRTILRSYLPIEVALGPAATDVAGRRRVSDTTLHRNAEVAAAANPSTNPVKDHAVGGQYAPLNSRQQQFLDSALRVNHAGELAAVLIYKAQIPPVIRAHPHLRPLMKHMLDQEQGHFDTFNALLAKHRIRPTVMYPLWKAAATALGWGTAIMGREAAMACTEAVETEIGDHYNSQVRVMLQWLNEIEARGEVIHPDIKELITNIKRIRDEELEHLDHAVEHDAKAAQPYDVLTNVIRSGCKAAIWISEKV